MTIREYLKVALKGVKSYIDNNFLRRNQGQENYGMYVAVGTSGYLGLVNAPYKDLSNYQTKTEVDLNTESKEITGAINELLEEINALKTEIDSLKSTQESGEM